MKGKARICLAAVVAFTFLFLITIVHWDRRNANWDATILMTTNQALLFRHSRGVGIVRFLEIEFESTIYEYRFLADSSENEIHDRVHVAHRSLRVGPIDVDISSPSSHYIHAGDVWLSWSFHNSGQAWITYHRGNANVALLNADEFERVSLIREAPKSRHSNEQR